MISPTALSIAYSASNPFPPSSQFTTAMAARVSQAPSRSEWKGAELGEIRILSGTGGDNILEIDRITGTGQVFGPLSGFSKLDHAIEAAQYVTRGSGPAVAVLMAKNGTYHLRGVRYTGELETAMSDPDIALPPTSKPAPFHFEAIVRDHAARGHMMLKNGIWKAHPAMRAVVDGDLVQRYRMGR